MNDLEVIQILDNPNNGGTSIFDRWVLECCGSHIAAKYQGVRMLSNNRVLPMLNGYEFLAFLLGCILPHLNSDKNQRAKDCSNGNDLTYVIDAFEGHLMDTFFVAADCGGRLIAVTVHLLPRDTAKAL